MTYRQDSTAEVVESVAPVEASRLARSTDVEPARRRGWVVRRMLFAADVIGLTAAFFVAQWLFGEAGPGDRLAPLLELVVFFATLPVWIVAAKLYGLYDRDEERTDHSGVDEFADVFHLVTVGSWVVFAVAWITQVADPVAEKMLGFWVLAILFVTVGRAVARLIARRSAAYVQRTVIVGAGEVGQLIARKLLLHPEYRIDVVGFVDTRPKERRPELEHLPMLGATESLPEIVRRLDVDRVIIAFSNDSPKQTISLVRALREVDVQLDVVPRLFDVVGPNAGIHMVEGLTLVTVPVSRLSRSSYLLKRALDVVLSAFALVLAAPALAYIAVRIKLDSPGPVLFRQTRLTMGMREFTALKFRTMRVDAGDLEHREYVKETMNAAAVAEATGFYKLERKDAVTPFGSWLRKTSLDELPQLWNVLWGDMSLVGPRPCIPYETENFAPHHFERFLVPAGLTGLWQVTARARSTFGEALEMDVAYARRWSFGLDLQLLCRTPLQLFRLRGSR